jgi:homogentisate 1,2-dioxygenase
VVSFSPVYEPKPFSPPTYVYENEDTRIELQDMNGRQPFYHRNVRVDEMSYQVTGPRMLITELGTVNLEPGDFVRLPVSVAHDNWGREEIHLLFYVRERMVEQLPALRRSEPHVFREWQPAQMTEMIGDGDVRVYQMSDERLLLEQAHADRRRLDVVRVAEGLSGTTWVWKSPSVWIGLTEHTDSPGAEYQRHRVAEEVQYQTMGTRSLVSQHGWVELEPGDFVKLPRGCAFTSVCQGQSRYVSLLSALPLRRVADASRQGELRSADELARLRPVLSGR